MVSRTDFDVYLLTDRGRIQPQSYDCVVKLFPGEDFSIVATNNTNLKAKAKFYLSGTYIGTLVIPKYQRCELKRPIEGVDRCFRYCEFGTSIAEIAKLDPNKPHSDEVTVIFYSEDISKRLYASACAEGYASDVTEVLIRINLQKSKRIMEVYVVVEFWGQQRLTRNFLRHLIL